MRLRWGVAAAASLGPIMLGLSLAAPGRARAQHVEVRASVTLTGAYSQTLTEPAFPTASTYAGPSLSLSPSIVALVDTPRTTNSLVYAFSLSVPFTQTLAPTALTYSNRFGYSGHYDLDEITAMTFAAAFVESPLNSLVPSQDPTEATIQTTPPGVAYVITVNGSEGFTRQIGERTSFTQGGGFAFGNPIDPTSIPARTYSAANTLGLTQTFASDSLGVTLTNQLNYVTAGQDAALDVTLAGSTYLNTLALNWSRPFSERLTGSFVAGATQVVTPGALTLTQVQPTGSATLGYAFNYAAAALAYSHAAAPNLATASVNFNDTASLRFGAPIGLTGLVATGTAGFAHSVPIASAATPVAGTITGPANVYLADVALDYHPERAPTLTVGARGQLARQAPVGDPVNTFTRYTIALNLTYSYPNANAAALRPQLAPLMSAAPPSGDVITTDRFFSAPIGELPPSQPSQEAPPEP